MTMNAIKETDSERVSLLFKINKDQHKAKAIYQYATVHLYPIMKHYDIAPTITI